LIGRFKLDETVDIGVLKKTLSITKTNSAQMNTMTDPIAVFLDLMDDKEDYTVCPFATTENKSKWIRNLKGTLETLCARAYDYIDGVIKEETSEKKRGIDYVEDLIN